MSKPPPASKRGFRPQFSLLTFLLIVTTVGIGTGIWMAWVAPLRNQWAAVETLLEYGPRIETSKSKVPDWMKWVLPAGKTENIDALFIRDTIKLKDKDFQCFARLPHLKRLYLDQANLDDRGVAMIADCLSLQRLSLRNNRRITNQSCAVLAKMPNLQVVNIEHTGMDWRSMIEFSKRSQLEVIQDFRFSAAENSEIETMASFNNKARHLHISDSDETTIPRALKQFPHINYLQLDRFESLNKQNLERLKSLPNDSHSGVSLDLRHEQMEASRWKSILEVMEGDTLSARQDNYAVLLKYKDSTSSNAYLSLNRISPKDLLRLKELNLFSTIKHCDLYEFNDPEVDELEFLGWLANLETLELYNCKNPKRIDFASLSRNLRTVKIGYGRRLTSVANLTGFPHLSSIILDRCPLTSIENIDLPASTQLTISFPEPQKSIVDLGVLKHVRSLGNLNIKYCYGLTDLKGIEKIPGLETLRIGYCSKIENWDSLTKCRQLKSLIFDFDYACADKLPPPDLEFLRQLETLSFSNGRSTNDVWEEAWQKIVAERENSSVQQK